MRAVPLIVLANEMSVSTPLSGSIDLFNGFNAFKGTGSYFGGFQAGYNYLLPSGLALGVETDLSFANTISGTALMAVPSIGQASYTDNVQMFGTLRGRAGISQGQLGLLCDGGVCLEL